MRNWLSIGILAAFALLSAVSVSAADPDAKVVSTMALEATDYAVTLPPKAGVLVANEERTLAFEVTGRLKTVRAEGSRIAAGEMVASLEDKFEQALLRQAELRLRDARSQLGRTRGLSRSGAASAQALETAETVVAVFEAERDVAAESLARRRLRAPFAGVVVETLVEPGEVVSSGIPVGRLMDLKTLRVSVGLPSYQVGDVQAGSRASLQIKARGSERFDGVVLRVARAATEGGHLFEVEVEVANPRGGLRPGMVARVELAATTLTNSLAVPVESIVERGGEQVVYFSGEGAAREVLVAEGRAHGDLLILPAGVTPFRDLIIRGQRELSDGTLVRVDGSAFAQRPDR